MNHIESQNKINLINYSNPFLMYGFNILCGFCKNLRKELSSPPAFSTGQILLFLISIIDDILFLKVTCIILIAGRC